MPHFIEEAEQREKEIRKGEEITYSSASELLRNNQNLFSPFHENLATYIKKVANLSNESRRPVVEIGFTHLENDVKYEYFSSAYKTLTKKVFLVLKKEKIYIFWRRCYITIIDKPNIVKFTLYEKAVSETNYADVIKKKIKIYINIKDLNDEIAIWIMDYLGFKIAAKEVVAKIPHVNHLSETN